MRDAANQLTDGLHLLCLTQHAFSLGPLGYVGERQHKAAIRH
jgi:hypothetical protein